MAQIDADGQLGSMAEIELLVRVFERAQNVPVSLKEYAGKQIEKAVLEGAGPTRCGGELQGFINDMNHGVGSFLLRVGKTSLNVFDTVFR